MVGGQVYDGAAAGGKWIPAGRLRHPGRRGRAGATDGRTIPITQRFSLRLGELPRSSCRARRRHDILLCHDVPYADVGYDGYSAPSLLAVPGAKDIAIEFNSLSKSHNLAGWRVGMAVGNATAVKALLQVKSNIDSGIFLAIQEAAVAALTGDQAWIEARNHEYQRRRDALYEMLVRDWQVPVAKPAASLYLWPRVPRGYTSAEFAEKVLLDTGVSLTPGVAFGPHGEGYLRISVGQTTERVMAAVERMRKLKF